MPLAKDLHRLCWLFAHFSPYLRGTPIISGQFIDALWLHKGFWPPEKTFDENIEALCHLKWETFSDVMIAQLKKHPLKPIGPGRIFAKSTPLRKRDADVAAVHTATKKPPSTPLFSTGKVSQNTNPPIYEIVNGVENGLFLDYNEERWIY